MEIEQQMEWAQAQEINVSVDLIDAARNQLQFLAAIDRNRYLYDEPAMKCAIYRYNAYWIPLLAKHLSNPILDEHLVVPLDCEWIWHCHRLNPLRYKSDCEKIFGRVLGNHNIMSSVQGISKNKTKEIWNSMYPEEPYELDHDRNFQGALQKSVQSGHFTSYDLVSAVRRQTSFYYQISRPHVLDDLFLKEAFARYKGFLHLIRINKKKNINIMCVPTSDIDLMWHSHQLHPVLYSSDLIKLLGHVMQHDDNVSDREKGKVLDIGFMETTKEWEKMFGFGFSYWKAGAMYRRNIPNPVAKIPFPFINERKEFPAPNICDDLISIQQKGVVEVLLEFVELKNLPNAHKENICVSFSKKQPDMFFSNKRTLTIQSECGEKQVSCFQCEPSGEFIFDLMYYSPSNIQSQQSFKPFGSSCLSFEECLTSGSKLFVNKWLQVIPMPEILTSEPILLHVSLSFIPSIPAPQVYHMLQSQSFFNNGSYPLPLLKRGNFNHVVSQMYVIDEDGNDVLNLQIRDFSKAMTKGTSSLLMEVLHVTKSGETHTLAEFQGNEWSIQTSHGSLKLRFTFGNDDQLCELVGDKMVRLFVGRKLDCEPNECEKTRREQDFMTAVEFSAEYPYGVAVALFDFKHGILKVMHEWMTLTGITLAFILSNILRKDDCFTTKVGCENIKSNKPTNSSSPIENSTGTQAMVVENDVGNAEQGFFESGGGCDFGTGTKCGSAIESWDYKGGGGCGGGCGDMIISVRNGKICFEMAKCGDDRCYKNGFGNIYSNCGHQLCNIQCVKCYNCSTRVPAIVDT